MNHDLHFIEEAFGEQRANRAVNQARGQRFKFAWTAFALEETTRNAAGGIGFLKVINGQGKEVLTGLCDGFGNHGSQYNRTIHVNHDSATGLAGDFASFHRDLMLAPLE